MKALLYYHGGSDNRGCEAIVRSTVGILERCGYAEKVDVFTAHPEEDTAVHLEEVVRLEKNPLCAIPDLSKPIRACCKLYKKVFGTEQLYYSFTDKPFRTHDFSETVAFSIGGDHYCYIGGEEGLGIHNAEIKKKGGISVLWGCSVEPEILKNPKTVEDMKRYDLITARESLTYQALLDVGVEKAILCPDPAFTLGYKDNHFSQQISDNAVGINISTYALGDDGVGMKNYVQLIEHILKETDMDVWLIPHVFKSHTNDMLINEKLYGALKDTSRVHVIDERLTAEELKAVIRRCRFYVGARTHSTIAAYSSCVPTLVVGYSIKAKGIAKDIFGTHEHYVVPVQDLTSEDDLTKAFCWMCEHETEIKKHLLEFMPGYIQSAYQAGEQVMKWLK